MACNGVEHGGIVFKSVNSNWKLLSHMQCCKIINGNYLEATKLREYVERKIKCRYLCDKRMKFVEKSYN